MSNWVSKALGIDPDLGPQIDPSLLAKAGHKGDDQAIIMIGQCNISQTGRLLTSL